MLWLVHWARKTHRLPRNAKTQRKPKCHFFQLRLFIEEALETICARDDLTSNSINSSVHGVISHCQVPIPRQMIPSQVTFQLCAQSRLRLAVILCVSERLHFYTGKIRCLFVSNKVIYITILTLNVLGNQFGYVTFRSWISKHSWRPNQTRI